MDWSFLVLLLGLGSLTCVPIVSGQGGGGAMAMIPQLIDGVVSGVVRMRLQDLVKFVVGPSATPSPEMIAHAKRMRGEPKTRHEREYYVEMMKRIARVTPETYKDFLMNKTVQGMTFQVIDDVKLNAHITLKSLEMLKLLKAKKQRQAKEDAMKNSQERQVQDLTEQHYNRIHNMLFKPVVESPVAKETPVTTGTGSGSDSKNQTTTVSSVAAAPKPKKDNVNNLTVANALAKNMQINGMGNEQKSQLISDILALGIQQQPNLFGGVPGMSTINPLFGYNHGGTTSMFGLLFKK